MAWRTLYPGVPTLLFQSLPEEYARVREPRSSWSASQGGWGFFMPAGQEPQVLYCGVYTQLG